MNIAFSVAFFIFMYKYLPLLATTELKKVDPVFGQQIVFNLVDGLIRIAMFLLFVWAVSLVERHSPRVRIPRGRAQNRICI